MTLNIDIVAVEKLISSVLLSLSSERYYLCRRRTSRISRQPQILIKIILIQQAIQSEMLKRGHFGLQNLRINKKCENADSCGNCKVICICVDQEFREAVA